MNINFLLCATNQKKRSQDSFVHRWKAILWTYNAEYEIRSAEYVHTLPL